MGKRAFTQNKQEGITDVSELLVMDRQGTIQPGKLHYVLPKVRVGDYTSTMHNADIAVAKDREITLMPHRVLKYLEGVLGYENELPVSQKDVAAELECHASQVSQAFSLLIRKGILERIERPPLNPMYRLNPKYGWRGKHTKWKMALREAPPLALPGLVAA